MLNVFDKKQTKGEAMKVLSVKIDDDLHKQLKLLSIHEEKTMAEIVIGLVKKELETKKEQTQ